MPVPKASESLNQNDIVSCFSCSFFVCGYWGGASHVRKALYDWPTSPARCHDIKDGEKSHLPESFWTGRSVENSRLSKVRTLSSGQFLQGNKKCVLLPLNFLNQKRQTSTSNQFMIATWNNIWGGMPRQWETGEPKFGEGFLRRGTFEILNHSPPFFDTCHLWSQTLPLFQLGYQPQSLGLTIWGQGSGSMTVQIN